MNDLFNQIVLGDCIDVIKQLPDESVDMTFADPPFNLGKKYNSYCDTKNLDEYIKWCKPWIKEMVRVTKPTGSIFIHNIPKWLTYYTAYLNELSYFRHWIAWDAMGAPLGKTLLPNHYGILWYTKQPHDYKFYDIRAPYPRCRKCKVILQDYGGKKGQMHPFGPLVSDVWTDIHRIRHKKRRDKHPCQLPVHLLDRLILMTTDEGDVILDPFMGTGTTAVAAKRLGRNFIGIDIDQNYVDIANKNLESVKPTMLNGCYVSVFLDKIVTLRKKDWEKVSKWFVIPEDVKEVEHHEIKLKKDPTLRSVFEYNCDNASTFDNVCENCKG